MAHMASGILLVMQKVQRLTVEEHNPGKEEGEGVGVKVRHAQQGIVNFMSNMWQMHSACCDTAGTAAQARCC